MSENTKIEWCDHTFNPWEGCTKVSPGCAHCYAENRNSRFGGGTAPNWGKGAPRRRTSASNWAQPIKWNRDAIHAKAAHWPPSVPFERPRVFCASLADWLDDEVPIEWLADLLDLIRQTPHLDWLLLTKRPENWRHRICTAGDWMLLHGKVSEYSSFVSPWLHVVPKPPANVWVGTSVEDQPRADSRIPALLRIPARVHFLSMEPLLGSVDLNSSRGGTLWIGGQRGCGGTHFHHGRAGEVIHGVLHDGDPVVPHHHHDERCRKGLDWVIVGGESGPKARPMHPDWARSLRDQCAAAAVAFFFKQWGEWTPGENLTTQSGRLQCASYAGGSWEFYTQTDKQSENCHADDSPDVYRVGKSAAGRLLDGVEHGAFPEVSS